MKPIENNPTLAFLQIRGNIEQSSWETLSTLSNLKHLTLENTLNLTDTSVVGCCSSLEVLELFNNSSKIGVEILQELKQLRELSIVISGGNYDINALSNFKSLRKLSFSDNGASNITHSSFTGSIKELKLQTSAVSFSDQPDCSELVALELRLTGDKTIIDLGKSLLLRELKIIGSLNNYDFLMNDSIVGLKKLTLEANLQDIDNLNFLEKLASLEHLTFVGCRSLKDLKGIENLYTLQVIGIESTQVNSLSFLKNLRNLQEIRMRNTDVKMLRGAPKGIKRLIIGRRTDHSQSSKNYLSKNGTTWTCCRLHSMGQAAY